MYRRRFIQGIPKDVTRAHENRKHLQRCGQQRTQPFPLAAPCLPYRYALSTLVLALAVCGDAPKPRKKKFNTRQPITRSGKYDRHRTVGCEWWGADPSLGSLALQCFSRAPCCMYAALREK